MIVLVCGDRNWSHSFSIYSVLEYLKDEYGDIEVVEGGAKGADTLARQAAEKLGIPVREYPANWGLYGKRAGPIRNQKMLDKEYVELVIAFHNNIMESKGTKDMISRASKAGIRTTLYVESNYPYEFPTFKKE